MSSIYNDCDNFEEALTLPDNSYSLFTGYCYIEIIKPRLEYLGKIIEINCHRHYLYSCLKPECVYVPTAWMHTLTIARNFDKHVKRVHKTLWEILDTNAPVLMVEAPAAMHRYVHEEDKQGVSKEHIEQRRRMYYEMIINPVLHRMSYLDLNTVIPDDSPLVKENLCNEYNAAPWHMASPMYDVFCEIFITWKTKKVVEIPLSIYN